MFNQIIIIYQIRDTQSHNTELYDEQYVMQALLDMGYSEVEIDALLDLAMEGNAIYLEEGFVINFWGIGRK